MTVTLLVAMAMPLHAQDGAETMLAEAEALFQTAETPEQMAQVRTVLDQIIEMHPTSDIAIGILLGEQVGTIDVTQLNARLDDGTQALPEDSGAGETSAASGGSGIVEQPTTDPAASTAAQNASPLPPGTEATEQALDLSKQDIRDLQARLLVLGHDPNGVDGLAGRGTRAALGAWQAGQGVAATGYLNADQRARLQAQSETLLAAWRTDPENDKLYLPPPPIALGPGNLSGTWRFTTTCGRNSKLGNMRITGVMNVRHAGGNRYSGPVRQSQGFRGQFNGRLEERRMSGSINWGLLLGTIQVVGTIADQSLTMSGRDSNRCSFFARKA